MRTAPDGSSALAHRQQAAMQGSANAIGMLEDAPPFPYGLGYLWRWASELYGKSGVSQFGVNPLTYSTLHAWALLTSQWPTPWEVRALMKVDTALRRGEGALQTEGTEGGDAGVPRSKEITDSWPDKKRHD